MTRSGARYVVLPTPPFEGATPLATLQGVEQLKLYDLNPSAARAYVVGDALLGPGVAWQIEGLFQDRFDPRQGVLTSDPPPAPVGEPGSPVPASAVLVEDGLNRVVVRAGLPSDGYLALPRFLRSGVERSTSTASPRRSCVRTGLFRAVHLTRGEHTVSFTYRPRTLLLGAADHRRRRARARAVVPDRPVVSTYHCRGRSRRRETSVIRDRYQNQPPLVDHGRLPVGADACARSLSRASRIFYVRDLSFFFWSRHLWLRHTLASGIAPWWDPYVAGGQSAIVDALNQILMPIDARDPAPPLRRGVVQPLGGAAAAVRGARHVPVSRAGRQAGLRRLRSAPPRSRSPA